MNSWNAFRYLLKRGAWFDIFWGLSDIFWHVMEAVCFIVLPYQADSSS